MKFLIEEISRPNRINQKGFQVIRLKVRMLYVAYLNDLYEQVVTKPYQDKRFALLRDSVSELTESLRKMPND